MRQTLLRSSCDAQPASASSSTSPPPFAAGSPAQPLPALAGQGIGGKGQGAGVMRQGTRDKRQGAGDRTGQETMGCEKGKDLAKQETSSSLLPCTTIVPAAELLLLSCSLICPLLALLHLLPLFVVFALGPIAVTVAEGTLTLGRGI